MYWFFKKDTETDEELIEAFKVFDRDGNGSISADELRNVIQILKLKIEEYDVNSMIKEADLDHDGHINFEDFLAYMINKSK